MSNKKYIIYLVLTGSLLAMVVGYYMFAFGRGPIGNSSPTEVFPAADFQSFDGFRAYADVKTQVEFGPRFPGSEAHSKLETWIQRELAEAGWKADIQETSRLGYPVRNILAKRSDLPPVYILAAHYDTRMYADNDPDFSNRTKAVPGANDGASGVAILLELARTLPLETEPVWLVFFDSEDQGRIDGWDWILGSRAFVDQLEVRPQGAIIIDMVGDADLNIYYEQNSDNLLRREIWNTASSLGYGESFIQQEKYSMEDDHTPFLEAGIPAVDIIDFDYPYWHTTQDTPDKISAASLKAVGDTLWHWLASKKP